MIDFSKLASNKLCISLVGGMFPMSRRSPQFFNGYIPLLAWVMFCVASLHFSGSIEAQVVDPVTAAQTPVPGSGHHYIGMGAETVNPSDGSVSFNLPIQLPIGRQLTIPFSIRFNEASPFSISNAGGIPNRYFYWQTASQLSSGTPFSVNGWSYELPRYQAQAFLAFKINDPQACLSLGHGSQDCPYWDYCLGTQGYSFSGLDGVSHVLDVAYLYEDPNDASGGVAGICNSTGWFGLGGVARGGFVGISTSLGARPQGIGINVHPPMTVVDRAGIQYTFPAAAVINNGSTLVNVQASRPQAFGQLAKTITDSNGNLITLNGTDSDTVSVVAGTNTLPSGSYKDTLGRNILTWSGIGGTTGDTITISGLSHPITVAWTNTTVTFPDSSSNSTMISQVDPISSTPCGFGGTAGIQTKVVSEIDLPNTQSYRFYYGSQQSAGSKWGRLSKIVFPDGGYVRYVWGINAASKAVLNTWSLSSETSNASGTATCWAIIDTPAIVDRYVSYDGSHEVLHQHFDYSTEWQPNQQYWSKKHTTMTSNDLVSHQTTKILYTYVPTITYMGSNDGRGGTQSFYVYEWQAPQTPVEQSVVYQGGNNDTLKTVHKSWKDQYAMMGEQTILDNAQSITTIRCVDYNDRVTDFYEYDFGGTGTPSGGPCDSSTDGLEGALGTLLRHTVTKYHQFSSAHILDSPDSVTTFAGSDTSSPIKQTLYGYLPRAVATSGTDASLLAAAPGGTDRGNIVSVSRWMNTSKSYLTTNYTYFDTGQIKSMTDPRNNITNYSYTDSFDEGSSAVQTNAYLTLVTYPMTSVAHTESFTWGFDDGLLRSHTDQNSQKSTYSYDDPLLRLTQVQGPADSRNGNQKAATSFSYHDWTSVNHTLPSSMAKSELQNTSGVAIQSTSIMDGMGHVVQAQSLEDNAAVMYVDTVYDGMGHVASVSNPYRSQSEVTYGLTTFVYDPLGRKQTQFNPDSVSSQSWGYSGTTVTFANENSNQWARTSDALGRLTKVLEPNSVPNGTPMLTEYSYDLLDNLASVTQWGGAKNSTGARLRSFSYDSLSRLIQSYNPETGWTCYGITLVDRPSGTNCISGYDPNGNLTNKTDARNVVVNYAYDALNRVISKSYQNDLSKTPTSCYQYDASSFAGTNAYLVGRLTNQWTQSSSSCAAAPPSNGIWTRRSVLAYDVMGRVVNEQQCTPANCTSGTPYASAYSYDLAGEVHTSSTGITSTPNSNTMTLTNEYDSAGRLKTVKSDWVDSLHPTQLFSAQTTTNTACDASTTVAYSPFGSLMNALMGNGLMLNRAFDKRLRTTCEVDMGGVVASPTNGSATISIPGAEQSK